jgi:hypothetical protein
VLAEELPLAIAEGLPLAVAAGLLGVAPGVLLLAVAAGLLGVAPGVLLTAAGVLLTAPVGTPPADAVGLVPVAGALAWALASAVVALPISGFALVVAPPPLGFGDGSEHPATTTTHSESKLLVLFMTEAFLS